MHSITCRIHRSSPTTIDLDYQVTPTLIVTAQYATHDAAVASKQLFDAAETEDDKIEIIRLYIHTELPGFVA